MYEYSALREAGYLRIFGPRAAGGITVTVSILLAFRRQGEDDCWMGLMLEQNLLYIMLTRATDRCHVVLTVRGVKKQHIKCFSCVGQAFEYRICVADVNRDAIRHVQSLGGVGEVAAYFLLIELMSCKTNWSGGVVTISSRKWLEGIGRIFLVPRRILVHNLEGGETWLL